MTRTARALPFVLGMLFAGTTFAAKIEHTKVVPPKFALEAPAELQAIGHPTRLLERGGTLYVAGVDGIAALSADGKLLWSTPLDTTGVREIAIDDSGIAYTGYQIIGAKTSVWAFLGDVVKKLEFAPSVVGMLGPDGAKRWQANGPSSRISAPCLTPNSVAVLTGEKFHIYSRADGALTVSTMDLEPAMLPNSLAGRMYRPAPFWINNEFVGGYYYNFYRIGPAGEEINKENKVKTNIVAGPMLFQGKILVGSYSTAPDNSVNKSLVTLVEPSGDFGKVWREDIADDHSATGDIVIDGDTIYASTNFTLAALDAKGKKIWDEEGKEGALTNGSMRGVRFTNSFGYRYWGGHLLALVGDRLYLSTRREVSKKNWQDVITVVSKKDGSYVETLDIQKEIVDMAVWGGHLAIATPDGVKFLAVD